MLLFIGLLIIRANFGSTGLFQIIRGQCNTITNEVDVVETTNIMH
jgi:hypothetical protein